VQDLVIRQFLLLFEPFAPFITEELWSLLGYAAPGKPFVQSARIESPSDLVAALHARGIRLDAHASGRVETLKQFVTLARQLKTEQNVGQKRDVKFLALGSDAAWSALSATAAKLTRLVGAAEITRTGAELALPAIVTPFGTLFLDTGVKVDAVAEKARLTKELDTVGKHIAGTEARLANVTFTSKAPAAVLEGARKQLAELQAKRDEITRLLASL
jgi:valyl-tRNA synthetase